MSGDLHPELVLSAATNRSCPSMANYPKWRNRPAQGSDHQFFYEDGTNHVLSFDHGHFFPGGPNWSTATLAQVGPALPDQQIVQQCNLTVDEISAAKSALGRLTTEVIVAAVAAPPTAWGLSLDERVALAAYLEKRRNELMT